MKRIIILVLLSVLETSLYAQKWESTIGQPNQYEASRRVIEHYDKGYLISAQLNEHGWMVKTDMNGSVLWDKQLGVGSDQVITEKTLYNDQGEIYIIGTIYQDIAPLWPVAIKLNACGDLQWCRQLYFEEYEFGAFYDAILLDNGDLLAVANMPDDDQHDMIFLFCISPEGEYKWKKSYASCTNYPNFEMRLGSRIQFFNDIYIITGYVYSPHPNYPNTSSIRPMFIGIDTAFNEQWVLEFGMVDNMKGKALTTIPINDSLFMGVGRYRYVDNTGMTKDAWAMFYNDKGEQTGYRRITRDKLGSEVNESTFYEVERINDSLYLAAFGCYYGVEDDEAMGEIVFDTAGNVYNYSLRENTTGGNSSVIKTFDNKFAIACSYQYPDLSYDVYFYKVNQNLEHDTVYPGNYTYDSLCTDLPIQSGEIDLTGCDVVTSIGEIPTLEEYRESLQSIPIKAFPNPVKEGELTFELQNTEHHSNMKLKVFNVFGEVVDEQKVYQYQGEHKANTKNWKAGLYVAIIYSNGKIAGKTKFVVQ
jgi:hypothetical protein